MTAVGSIYYVVNSIPLDTYAWRVIDTGYDDLLNGPGVNGEDLKLPDGLIRSYPRNPTGRPVSIPIEIQGHMDPDGGPFDGDPVDGLFTHRDYLRSNIGLFEPSGDGTVPSTFYRGDTLDPLEGDVTVIDLAGFTRVGESDGLIRLDLFLPLGELIATGS